MSLPVEDEAEADAPGPPALCEYAVSVTAERLDRMLSHIDGVRRGDEPGPVHQMRVWSRRSRAALEIFRACFKGKAFEEIEREVKAAADAVGEARDLDVMIQTLTARSEKLPASQRAGIDSFVERLRGQRDVLQNAVAHAVTDLESHDLAQRFRDLARAAGEPEPRQTAAPERRRRSRRKKKGGARNG